MGNVMESLGYGLAEIGLIAAFLFLSHGVKGLCRNYLKRRNQYDDQ